MQHHVCAVKTELAICLKFSLSFASEVQSGFALFVFRLVTLKLMIRYHAVRRMDTYCLWHYESANSERPAIANNKRFDSFAVLFDG